jgi:hypothetical protein
MRVANLASEHQGEAAEEDHHGGPGELGAREIGVEPGLCAGS